MATIDTDTGVVTKENIAVEDGYHMETKANGNKLFICKQCEKEIKTEQGIKSHIANKHRKKRVRLETSTAESLILEEKKLRYDNVLEEDNTEFEFDPLSMHTSSQLLADSSQLDETAKIVQEYMANSKPTGSEIDISSVDEIVVYRTGGNNYEFKEADDTLAIPLNQEQNSLCRNFPIRV